MDRSASEQRLSRAIRVALGGALELASGLATLPTLPQIGLGPPQESQFFVDTFGCADNRAYCAATDYNIVFAGHPDLAAEESENFNSGAAWKPTDSRPLVVDYWDIKQDKKIDEVDFGCPFTQFCNVLTSDVCVRGTPLPSDTLGPLRSVNSSFINIGEQSTNGVEVSVHFRDSVMGGESFVDFDYSRMLEFKKRELSSDGASVVTRDLTGEYEYPEDRFVPTGDWGFDVWG